MGLVYMMHTNAKVTPIGDNNYGCHITVVELNCLILYGVHITHHATSYKKPRRRTHTHTDVRTEANLMKPGECRPVTSMHLA